MRIFPTSFPLSDHARVQVTAMAEETETQRAQVTELARATAYEAEKIARRQQQLQEQTFGLLRGVPSERAPYPRCGAPCDANVTRSPDGVELVGRANYTASALGAFTLPLMASRAAGLIPERVSSIETATVMATSSATAPLDTTREETPVVL